jgi:hypothetical protein
MTPLILKRASVSRSSGQWRDDDYDVLENGVVVRRIFLVDRSGPALDMGERPQRRLPPRGARLRAYARGGDGRVREVVKAEIGMRRRKR